MSAVQVGIHQLVIQPGQPGPKIQLIKQQLYNVIRIFLQNAAKGASKAASAKAKELEKSISGETQEKLKLIALAAYGAIIWDDLVKQVQDDLLAAAEAGVDNGIAQLEVTDEKIIEAANNVAVDYSVMRSAEMIGKELIDGKLLTNPQAEWVIAQTTKDDLIDVIEAAFAKDKSLYDIEGAVLFADTFNKDRAELIAKAETAAAQVIGNLDIWKRTGIVKSINVVLSSRHAVYDDCDTIVEGNPYPINKAPFLPLHPLCECSFEAIELNG